MKKQEIYITVLKGKPLLTGRIVDDILFLCPTCKDELWPIKDSLEVPPGLVCPLCQDFYYDPLGQTVMCVSGPVPATA